LEYIRQLGISQYIEEQYAKHRCSRCGGLISIHNRKCFRCDKVTTLVEKSRE
jgi:ribosomal protein L40E